MIKVTLDFQIDENQLAEDLEEDPSLADDDLILLTYFIMPVRIQINKKEFFAYKGTEQTDPWIGMPIVNIAFLGLHKVLRIPSLKKVNFFLPEGPGTINFEMLEINKVRVIYKPNNIDEVVSYDDLLKAFLDFNAKVKKFLNERVPQMRDHPYWGAWVRGELE